MDPITAAILAALLAGAVSGVTKVGENVISDAYQGLKSLIQRKFGSESKVAKSVKDLEDNQESQGQKLILSEEIAKSKADKDPEIIAAANNLLAHIKAQPGGQQLVMNVTGDRNITFGGNATNSTFNTGDKNPIK